MISALGPSFLDAHHILSAYGTSAVWIVAAILFAECGLLVGFFLPGDTLLFSAGLFIGTGAIHENLWLVCLILAAAAFLGNALGYEIGYRAGPAVFKREDSRLFKREYVDRAHAFFVRFGAPAIVLARFVPFIRTFITVVAGVSRMSRRKYLLASALGAAAWAAGMTLLGYYLGSFAFVRNHIEPHLDVLLVIVVVLSIVPPAIHLLRSGRKKPAARVH